jgi:hypothetical protein
MTTGLHRQVSLKLAAIVREGASRWRLSCDTRAWAAEIDQHHFSVQVGGS